MQERYKLKTRVLSKKGLCDLLNGKQTDRGRRHEADGELSSFGDIVHVNTYVSLPLAQRRTQQIVARFNAAEELWRSLEAKRRGRRARYPEIPSEFHRQLDLLDFANAQLPQDCIGFVLSLTKQCRELNEQEQLC